MAHAKELLDAAVIGYDIEIFKSDDLDAFRTVFGDFIRGPEYYAMSEERQEYIRDVFIAIENAEAPPEQLAQENMQEKVFPRTPKPTADSTAMLASVMGNNSGAAQSQQLAEAAGMSTAEAGFGAAENALAQRGEALTQNISPGGIG